MLVRRVSTKRRGFSSKAAVALAVVLVIVVAGAAYFSLDTRTGNASSTSSPSNSTTNSSQSIESSSGNVQSISTTSNATQEVEGVYATYVRNFRSLNSMNVTALVNEYENNATLFVGDNLTNGDSNCCTFVPTVGAIHDSGNIEVFYDSVYGSRGQDTANITETNSETFEKGTSFVVNSTFTISGNETYMVNSTTSAIAKYSGTISLSSTYMRVGNGWLIAYQQWLWNTYTACGPIQSESAGVPRCQG